jgi:hypothetical protein
MYSKEKPEIITRDHRGTLIEPGLRVAYNFSGDVALGTIIEVKKNNWKERSPGWWSHEFELHVRNENGHLSKIKNCRSFIII